MGILTETLQSLIPFQRAQGLQGPLPLTAARVVEWLSGPPTASGVAINPSSALKIAACYACVRLISEDVAKLPLILYRRLERGKDRAFVHPLFDLLHNSPNVHMTSMQFRETMQAHLLLWGNAYANIERDPSGRIIAIWPLRPDRMDAPVLAEDGRLLYTYLLSSGERRALTQDDIFHIRGLANDGIMGYSPIALQRETLGWAQATRDYSARFYGADTRPGGILKVDRRLTAEGAEKLRNDWNTLHQGLQNKHRIAVLEEGVEFQAIGMSPEDTQFVETQTFQVEDIARIFRTPPHMIMDLSRATYSNIEEQGIEYVVNTLGAWLVRWEQQINKDLLLPDERRQLFAEHLLDALLRGTIEKRYAAYAQGLLNGFLSPNDVREKENLNPIPDGDIYLQQANMVPLGTEPAPPQPRTREIRRTADGYEIRG